MSHIDDQTRSLVNICVPVNDLSAWMCCACEEVPLLNLKLIWSTPCCCSFRLAARFVAKLRELQTSSNLLLLQVDKDDPDLTKEALGSVQESEGSHARLL